MEFIIFAEGTHDWAGVMSVLVTYPLELIRVRMAFETGRSNSGQTATNGRPSFFRAISRIYHEGAVPETTSPAPPKRLFQRFPILKFYRGFTVTIVGMIPYAGTSFLTWGFLRARFLAPPAEGSGKKKSTPIADLGFGAIAGAISQTASYPFEIVRRRMQVGGLTKPENWMSWNETVRAIWKKSGWRGFYVGLSIGYLKIVPMTAISFTVWQAGKNILGV
jgi:solute carrier family 25 protein 16